LLTNPPLLTSLFFLPALINARGTFESQAESSGFVTMNKNTAYYLAGGSVYNVVYPAAADQNSRSGTEDVSASKFWHT
jgi:hypothetical protein